MERAVKFVRAALARLKQRNWKAWFGLVALLLVLQEIVLHFIPDISFSVAKVVWRGVVWFGGQPMWIGGILLVGFVMLLLGLSYWETRPVKVKAKGGPPPLSTEESALVQDHRTLWELHGRAAAEHLNNLFDSVQRDLDEKSPFAPLLLRIGEDLRGCRERWAGAVADNSSYTIAVVRERFNATYSAYLECCRWLATINNEEFDLRDSSHHLRLLLWQDLHKKFWDAIEVFLTRPAHKKTLNVYVEWIPGTNDRLQKFLRQTGQDVSMFKP